MKLHRDRSPSTVKKLTVTAMLAALAFLLVATIRIPVVMFLKYEPKDIIITIGGFIYGPATAALISLIVAIVEMVTISTEGIIGCIMNFLSSAAFSVPAAIIYSKKRNLKGAVIGLITGALSVCATMMLWNYLITPLYMKVDRAQIAAMLPTMFLPFNLLKATLNAALTMIIYKPTVKVLRAAKLLPASESTKKGGNTAIIAIISAVFVAAVCIFLIIYWQTV
ncbi:MAG: ECF transporter S component [Clostridia bacterium]|nr:ECF transporter S component [Clostridia bacterium]